ncbi:hypothetical protein [Halochromatium sp.]
MSMLAGRASSEAMIVDTDQVATQIGEAERLIEQASKEQLAEALCLLAMSVGYYQTRSGPIPHDAVLEMIKAERLDDEQRAMVIAGMQNLASALAQASGSADPEAGTLP